MDSRLETARRRLNLLLHLLLRLLRSPLDLSLEPLNLLRLCTRDRLLRFGDSGGNLLGMLLLELDEGRLVPFDDCLALDVNLLEALGVVVLDRLNPGLVNGVELLDRSGQPGGLLRLDEGDSVFCLLGLLAREMLLLRLVLRLQPRHLPLELPKPLRQMIRRLGKPQLHAARQEAIRTFRRRRG